MKEHKRPLHDLDRDIREHIEIETRENIDNGMTPEEAHYVALRKFGNPALVKEDVRAVWIQQWLEHLGQDLRYGLRTLAQKPAGGHPYTVVGATPPEFFGVEPAKTGCSGETNLK